MIEFANINKSFHGKQVLKDVSGSFIQGKCNLLIGASGTGKSVLLKCLVGLIQPDSGRVLYDGRDFTNADSNLKQEIRREIGMLFQGGALFDSKNVEENVMFPLDLLTNMPKDEKLDRVNYCLKRVGLENTNKLMPSEISGGMKKRVGIARAIVMNSKYLFCDEPNSGLDPQTSILIDNLIKDITLEYNITTVVVTHDMNSVMEIGEHIIFVHKGEKVWEGSKADILQTDNKPLQDFLFASRLVRELRANN
ncbi:MAG: ATP-binding cassette domain-containing protein [Cytophagaceae bacterium]|nr:ATP-binding cassette domain-containing protein [Cytophagaceae bacterium]MDW8456486.1 ATP-binding cassette domain-containing protein [Cytophagaceae bacterium]